MNDYTKIRAELEERLQELNARVEEIEDDLSQPGDDDWSENAIESEDEKMWPE